MMHATNVIRDFFDSETDLDYTAKDYGDDGSCLCLGIGEPGMPNFIISIINTNDGNDSTIHTTLFRDIAYENDWQNEPILKAINKINRNCRHVRFVLTEEGNVDLFNELSPVTPDEMLGRAVMFAMNEIIEAVEEAYPLLKKALEHEKEEDLWQMMEHFRALLDDDDNNTAE